MAESNRAAYLTGPKAHPFVIKPAPTASPKEGQILIRSRAVAVNPIDGKLQRLAIYPLNYPTVLGSDVAGEVIKVGPETAGFSVGDRVLGCTMGFGTGQDSDKAFQEHVILQQNMASRIPDGLDFARAVVLPLGVATASAGLFLPNFLGLRLPTSPATAASGETLLIWGGASSVGSNAIQLAVAAGYEVTTTASEKNFEHVRKLGASHIFDYRDSAVVESLVAHLKDKKLVGVFDAVGGAAWVPAAEVLKAVNGTGLVATTIPRFPDPPEGVTMKQVQSLEIAKCEVAKAVFNDFLPAALKAGTFVPAPEPKVVGTSLEAVQDAIDLYAKGGLSASKLVVTLD